MDKYLSQRDQAIHSSEELSGDGAGTESEYNDSNDDNNADSDGNDTLTDIMKDAPAQITVLLDLLSLFILTSYGNEVLLAGLVQFLAVLGIDTKTKRLRTAKNYLYMLAGMVYCIWVVGVEKLLPAAGRDEQIEEARDRFLEMRKKYLANGSYSPTSEMISLLAYSKHAALNKGNAGNAYWSLDKKIFYLNGRPIVIERFHQMAQSMQAEVVEQFWQLCWVNTAADRFSIDLAQISDDVTFTTQGMSFVSNLANSLKEGGMQLQTADGRWRGKKVRQYLLQITTMRHRNGLLQDRNIFIVDGAVMTVVVPRFLPPHDYVWSNGQGAWGTDKLTKVLKRETGKRLGVRLHTQGYRHAAIGIGRVKVGESFGRGYQDEVGEVDEAEVDEDQEDIVELQNSRTTAMGVGNYSVPIDIVKHLSVRSIDAFRALSTAWHRFLGVDGLADELVEPSSRRKRRMRESISGLVGLPREKTVPAEDPRAETVHKALQQVLGKQDVGFRSAEQEQALYAVLDNQTPLVVVLPTGGGKSLLFTVLACIEDEWKRGDSNPIHYEVTREALSNMR
ncbi:hypothetical protein C7974DRAFT_431476 [Boeremia exigua]|uniref:uncharacterized protein n=1 Tax=Boeremia exigua TaxID=749465 RepID=UPI001E8DD66D|nr:uncharacterized protein C7974DRAFT_431476 [Boeremia exigua]KAH6643244.1 hypothetical protein C7974DRAFT_431476 [Boeremia exigua]